ncbi:MAG: SPOR domain-containing protein [Nitrospirota bacterium]|nr:SPOR domain-containing protein [Nitrospirota bacterium]
MEAIRKVLVIDDDAAACGLIEEVLTRHGIEVLISPDARAGLEAARALIPDLIFINLLLSDTNGLKVSKAIHVVKSLEKVPVIMLISHRGELDPKYTVSIGILDTLVKPLKEAEIIAKTIAVLGNAAVTEPEDETIRDTSFRIEMEPMIFHEEEEMIVKEEPASAMETRGEPVKDEAEEQDERKTMSEMTTEGESYMPEKENPFNRKDDDARNLFTDESDIFGDELKKPHTEAEEELLQEKQDEDRFPDEDIDLSYEEEKPASPVRRMLLITASIVAGIALGVGGYLFFTAGNKHAPLEKQVTGVLPEPVAIPIPPVVPVEKPNVIPEIPVKAEMQKPVTAQAKEAKPQEKKLLTPKQASKKETPAAAQGKGAYYVQAGLFENEKNANTVAQKIKKKGFTPTVRKLENARKKTLYRVTVGSYGSHKKAVEVADALGKQGVKAIVRKQ